MHIPYPHNAGGQGKGGQHGHQLPPRPEGRSFHHGRFIQQLRQAARETPNVTIVETKATELVQNCITGEVLGVESKTDGEPDYVCCYSFMNVDQGT